MEPYPYSLGLLLEHFLYTLRVYNCLYIEMEEFLLHHVHLDLQAKALEPLFPVGSLGIWTCSGEILGQLYAENMTYESYCGDRLGALGNIYMCFSTLAQL